MVRFQKRNGLRHHVGWKEYRGSDSTIRYAIITSLLWAPNRPSNMGRRPLRAYGSNTLLPEATDTDCYIINSDTPHIILELSTGQYLLDASTWQHHPIIRLLPPQYIPGLRSEENTSELKS